MQLTLIVDDPDDVMSCLCERNHSSISVFAETFVLKPWRMGHGRSHPWPQSQLPSHTPQSFLSTEIQRKRKSTMTTISMEKQALGPRPLLPYEASHTHLSFLQMGPAPPSQLPHILPCCVQVVSPNSPLPFSLIKPSKKRLYINGYFIKLSRNKQVHLSKQT